MTTLEVTLTLSDQLAQAAQRAGLLTGSAIERLIAEALQREAGQQLLDAMQRLRDAPGATAQRSRHRRGGHSRTPGPR